MTILGYALADWIAVASVAAAGAAALAALRYRRLYKAARQRAASYAADLVSTRPHDILFDRADVEAQLADLSRELLTTRDQLASARSVHAQHMRRCIGLRNYYGPPKISG